MEVSDVPATEQEGEETTAEGDSEEKNLNNCLEYNQFRKAVFMAAFLFYIVWHE